MNTIVKKSTLVLLVSLFMAQSISAMSYWEQVKNYFGSVARTPDNSITTVSVFGEHDNFVGTNEQITDTLYGQHLVKTMPAVSEVVAEKVTIEPPVQLEPKLIEPSKADVPQGMLNALNPLRGSPLALSTLGTYLTPCNVGIAVGIGAVGYATYAAYKFYDTLRFLTECEKEFSPKLPSFSLLKKAPQNVDEAKSMVTNVNDKLVRLMYILGIRDIKEHNVLGQVLQKNTQHAAEYVSTELSKTSSYYSENRPYQFVNLVAVYLTCGGFESVLTKKIVGQEQTSWYSPQALLLSNYKKRAEWLCCKYFVEYIHLLQACGYKVGGLPLSAQTIAV